MAEIKNGRMPSRIIPSVEDTRFDDLIEKQPGWLLYSGIPAIFFCTLLCLALAFFIKYPDKMSAPCMLTTQLPPVEVFMPVSEKIDTLFVTDRQPVKKGDRIAYIENAASLPDVIRFVSLLEFHAQTARVSEILAMQAPENLHVGELQPVYLEYLNALNVLREMLIREKIVAEKIGFLKTSYFGQEQLAQTLQKQSALSEKALSLAEKDFYRASELNRSGVISDVEFEKNESQLLSQQQQSENIRTLLIQNHVQRSQVGTEMATLKLEQAENIHKCLIRLNEIVSQSLNEYYAWQKKYFIQAPINGILSYSPDFTLHQSSQAGTLLASIIPSETGNRTIVRVNPPANGIGKMAVGDKVLIYLDAFPYREFGCIESRISSISILPVSTRDDKKHYEVICNMPDSLVTSAGRPLPFRQKLMGNAQIITNEKSIIQRILERVLHLNT